MILPLAFANLAANGTATTAFVPLRDKRWVRRKNRTRYESTPWAPTFGRHEPLLSQTARETTKVADVIIGTNYKAQLLDVIAPEQHALVRSAGYKKRHDFADTWMRHYDRAWPILTEDLCPKCGGHTVTPDGLECENCDPVGVILVEEHQTPDFILERFTARHGHTIVHVVHFELDHLAVRYLSPAARPRGDDLGYTTTTDFIDAGEAVPLSFQIQQSEEASERDHDLRLKKIEQGDLEGLGQAARNRRRAQGRDAA